MLTTVFLFLTIIAEVLGVFRFIDLNILKDAMEHEKATMAIWVALAVALKGRAPPQIPGEDKHCVSAQIMVMTGPWISARWN